MKKYHAQGAVCDAIPVVFLAIFRADQIGYTINRTWDTQELNLFFIYCLSYHPSCFSQNAL
jgi:hypothetical protein